MDVPIAAITGVGSSASHQQVHGGSVSLTPVDVVLMIGESNTVGARNAKTELPTGYYATDDNAFIWDDATTDTIVTLIPGPLEQQPGGAAYVDPAFTNTVGACGEFVKHYRADNPSKALYFFVNAQGGGRFSDAASRGRAANYTYNLSDGAYNEMKVSWLAFVAALNAAGKTPNIIVCRINLGGNTAGDATESSNFQTALTNLIAQMRTDMIGNAKVVIDRYGAIQSGLNQTNVATIKTAIEAIATADSTKVEIMSLLGMPCNATDNIHLTAAAQVAVGEQLYYHAAGLWYPQKEMAYNGGNPCTHEYRPGDLRNTAGNTAFTTTAGNVQTCRNVAGATVNPTQGTDANRPVVSVTNTPNGYPARYATGNGTSQILISTTVQGFSTASVWGAFGAMSVTATNLDAIFAEASSTDSVPFYEPMKMNGSGDMTALGRNNTAGSTIFVNNATLVTGAFNGTMNFVASYGSATSLTGHVNGTTGTPQSITRGTVTCDRFALFGLAQLSSPSNDNHWANAKIGILWFTSAQPDATYLSNARAYCQRRWGTA